MCDQSSSSSSSSDDHISEAEITYPNVKPNSVKIKQDETFLIGIMNRTHFCFIYKIYCPHYEHLFDFNNKFGVVFPYTNIAINVALQRVKSHETETKLIDKIHHLSLEFSEVDIEKLGDEIDAQELWTENKAAVHKSHVQIEWDETFLTHCHHTVRYKYGLEERDNDHRIQPHHIAVNVPSVPTHAVPLMLNNPTHQWHAFKIDFNPNYFHSAAKLNVGFIAPQSHTVFNMQVSAIDELPEQNESVVIYMASVPSDLNVNELYKMWTDKDSRLEHATKSSIPVSFVPNVAKA